MARSGRGSVKLNTVPLPELPPPAAVPYKILPDKTKSACGLAPSPPPVKLYRFVKPEPSVLIANRVPLLEAPPAEVVPYRVLPDKVNPPCGPAPLVPPGKLYRLVKIRPLVLTANSVPLPEVPPAYVVPYSMFPDNTSPANGNAPSTLVPVVLSVAV